MHILITAGPTREYLDDVRYLSNPSSGTMGFACAVAALRAGHEVSLVTGPVDLPPPPGADVVRVTSAEEMRDAAMLAYERADAVLATAAVSDYRPARRVPGKIKKGPDRMALDLVRTPDILAEMGRRKESRVLVGFALETRDEIASAKEKLRSKNLDLVVLNGIASFGSGRIQATLLRPAGRRVPFRGSKIDLARKLIALLPSLRRASAPAVSD